MLINQNCKCEQEAFRQTVHGEGGWGGRGGGRVREKRERRGGGAGRGAACMIGDRKTNPALKTKQNEERQRNRTPEDLGGVELRKEC